MYIQPRIPNRPVPKLEIHRFDSTRSNTVLKVKNSEGIHLIPVDEIVYFSAESSYTKIHLKDQKDILISKSLKHFDNMFLNLFIRIHQSFLINPKYLRKVSLNWQQVTLDLDIVLPVSRAKRDFLQQYIDQLH